MVKKKTFLLRLSPEMLGQLRALAEQELRSLNAQIEYLLREALKQKGYLKVGGSSGEDRKDPGQGGREKGH
jgi:hypothetical protein